MSEEQVLDDMRDENAMIERFLTGEYPRWPGKAESVARDVARRYMLARTNVQQLRAEVERLTQREAEAREIITEGIQKVDALTADLSTCQDGNVDLLNENHELRKELHTYQQMWAHVVKERDALKNEVEAAKQTINFLMDQLHPQDSQP